MIDEVNENKNKKRNLFFYFKFNVKLNVEKISSYHLDC